MYLHLSPDFKLGLCWWCYLFGFSAFLRFYIYRKLLLNPEEKQENLTQDKATETEKEEEEVDPDIKAIKFEKDKKEFSKAFNEHLVSYGDKVRNLKGGFKVKAVLINALYHYLDDNLEKILKYNLGEKYHKCLVTTYEKIQEFNVDCNIHMACKSECSIEDYNTVVLARTFKQTMENYKKNPLLTYILKEYQNN